MADLLTSDKLILRGEEDEIYYAYMRCKGTTLRVVPSAILVNPPHSNPLR